ncbi:hypothetical protein [uncultured Deefgea sp.]|uniref:hypothetical protein n=1 Tax=uncultured Deefgea sp. TaxID=1304914 RepID=UPI002593AECB|nr:hypothetical protein [uncultured Deefgea sp.]
MRRFVVYAVPRSLGWGLKTRPSAPSAEGRQTVLSFGSRQSRASGTDARSGRLSFPLSLATQRKGSPSRIATVNSRAAGT